MSCVAFLSLTDDIDKSSCVVWLFVPVSFPPTRFSIESHVCSFQWTHCQWTSELGASRFKKLQWAISKRRASFRSSKTMFCAIFFFFLVVAGLFVLFRCVASIGAIWLGCLSTVERYSLVVAPLCRSPKAKSFWATVLVMVWPAAMCRLVCERPSGRHEHWLCPTRLWCLPTTRYGAKRSNSEISRKTNKKSLVAMGSFPSEAKDQKKQNKKWKELLWDTLCLIRAHVTTDWKQN